MKKHVERTFHFPGVVSDLGGFGGLFQPDLSGMAEPDARPPDGRRRHLSSASRSS
jgi:hypothetical protein